MHLNRANSMAQHRQTFDTIIDGSMSELKAAFTGVVGESVKDVSGHRDLALEMMLTKFASDLQRSVDRFSHGSIESTWSKFDRNGDGVLQEAEIDEVVKSILSDIQTNLPEMVARAMEPAADNLQQWIESDAFGPMGMGHKSGGMNIALKENVQARIKSAADKLVALLGSLMKGLLMNTKPISGEIFSTIDANKDGKVSKEEFYDGFAEAFGGVIDFSKITRHVIAQRPNLQRSQSMVESDSGMILGAGLIVLAVASAAFMVYKRRPH